MFSEDRQLEKENGQKRGVKRMGTKKKKRTLSLAPHQDRANRKQVSRFKKKVAKLKLLGGGVGSKRPAKSAPKRSAGEKKVCVGATKISDGSIKTRHTDNH